MAVYELGHELGINQSQGNENNENKTLQDKSIAEISGETWDWFREFLKWSPTLLRPLVVLVVGLLLIRCLTGCLNKWLSRVKLPKLGGAADEEDEDEYSEDASEDNRVHFTKGRRIDPTVLKFFISCVSIGLKILLIIIVANFLGVETSAFIALLTAMGLAVGLALQGVLEDMAKGVMLIIFKPFKVGDYVQLKESCAGWVTEVAIVQTIIRSTDNAIHIVPNREIGELANISNLGSHRMDVAFAISNDEDFLKVRALILQTAAQEPMCLRQPVPVVLLTDSNEDGVEVTLRSWVRTANFEDYPPAIRERVKLMFDMQRIKIPRNSEVDPAMGR